MIHSESKEQKAVIRWARDMQRYFPALTWLHSSQAGVKMSAIQARIAKAEGMLSGISDLFLPYPNKEYAGLYIEMKKPKTDTSAKGVLSQNQKDFLGYANKVGYKAVVAYGATEAIGYLKEYLEIKG